MPEEPKIKRGKILRNRYENSSDSGNDMEDYVNTITDPGYPFALAEFEIKEALDYIRWSEQNGDYTPENWRMFQRRYGRSRGTFGELIQEIRAEREAKGTELSEEGRMGVNPVFPDAKTAKEARRNGMPATPDGYLREGWANPTVIIGILLELCR